ncbi:uncharacterized protein FOBCDRAFT_216329 [Fusarium oxysporum Fo47]|uniref:uncharacterized protein n=1 Tax=Fusarium oxysporum Fo47 TaxID=660027 RepID=UPI002869E38D|nr:uncharacterized protein FOBCDRAFT_216329 [Fusarium oxysporum Fo47]WJG34820.1 hypothetical protein FOBCDRAFT_216329 [Fusarium oxysporum Fo47]
MELVIVTLYLCPATGQKIHVFLNSSLGRVVKAADLSFQLLRILLHLMCAGSNPAVSIAFCFLRSLAHPLSCFVDDCC